MDKTLYNAPIELQPHLTPATLVMMSHTVLTASTVSTLSPLTMALWYRVSGGKCLFSQFMFSRVSWRDEGECNVITDDGRFILSWHSFFMSEDNLPCACLRLSDADRLKTEARRGTGLYSAGTGSAHLVINTSSHHVKKHKRCETFPPISNLLLPSGNDISTWHGVTTWIGVRYGVHYLRCIVSPRRRLHKVNKY